MPRSKHRKKPQNSNRSLGLSSNRPKKNKPNYLYIAASGIIAFLVIAGFVAGSCSGPTPNQNPENVGYTNKHVKGIGEKQEIMERDGKPTARHLDDGVKVDYNTVPPTSGDHWNRPEDCGWTSDKLPEEEGQASSLDASGNPDAACAGLNCKSLGQPAICLIHRPIPAT